MGFDKTKIKELYPGAEDLMQEVMLIHKSEPEQLKTACNSGDYFGQIKIDGAYYQFIKVGNGTNYLFGRTISKKTNLLTEKSANVPHIIKSLDVLPTNTVLIGEIYYPGGTSKNVTPIMGCLPEKAIDRQKGEYGYIHYYIHDILSYDGVNLCNTGAWDRYRILKAIFEKHNLESDYIHLAVAWEDDLYSRVGNALAAGEEGMVIKKRDGIYQPGKRPMDNLKAKQIEYVDAIIIGFEEPTKEYEGKEGDSWPYVLTNKDTGQRLKVTKAYYMGWTNTRIRIGAYDNGKIIDIGTIASGISDEMKEDMTNHPEKYLNKVCKIQAMSVDSKELTIRHGFYRGLHSDKNPTECTIKNIFK